MKKIIVLESVIILVNLKIIIVGIINVISTSKIRNKIVIKKNRIENGSREDEYGSNPHSNGVNFSRSFFFFLENNDAINIVIVEINIINDLVMNNTIIIYTIIIDLLIGSQIYLYTI